VVLESLSNKTSQFEEVIFCYVNNISGFRFISAQVLCTFNGDWLLIVEFFVNILYSDGVVHEVQCCLQR